MTLSTILICADKSSQQVIEGLIKLEPALSLVETVSLSQSRQKIKQLKPQLVWIDFGPAPVRKLALLAELKESFPGIAVLVSNRELDAELARTAYRLGALDFLDHNSWSTDLPLALKRLELQSQSRPTSVLIDSGKTKSPLSTLLICDANIKKRTAIEDLIHSQRALTILKTISTASALEQAKLLNPPLIWLELSPDPQHALSVLSKLRENLPQIKVFVSYDVPDANLIRSSYRLGASDFLDAERWRIDIGAAVKNTKKHQPTNKKKIAVIASFATIFAIFACIYFFIGSILSQPANINTLVLRPQPPNKSYDADPIKGIKKQSLLIPTKDGSTIHAWLFKVPNSTRLTIVNHGNAGNVSNRVYIADVLANAGSSSLVYDYRGYGKSTGVPTITGILEDGLTVYDYAREKMHYPADKILLYGESIGSAVTCNTASKRPVEAVILQSPIASLPAAAKHIFVILNLYPDFVFPEPHLDNLKIVETLNAPILILHGKKDHIVAFENSEQLYAKAHEPKKLVFLDDCGHNDMGVQNKELFYSSIKDFIGALK